jgi:hypothetical protein
MALAKAIHTPVATALRQKKPLIQVLKSTTF